MDSVTEGEPERKLRKGDPCPLIEDGKACGKPVFVEIHGWCSMHYARFRNYGDPLHKVRRYVRQGEKCIAPEGCDNKPEKDNLCHKHARLQGLYGETTNPRERMFWAQVDQSGGPDACWPWTGYVHPNGYGQFGAHTPGTKLPHRIAYEYLVGPIPEGKMLDHLCHTNDPDCPGGNSDPHRRCCNPGHLEPVEPRINIARGRGGDSWGYVPEPVPVKPKLKPQFCVQCGRKDKPVYKSGVCRPCYRKRMKDPDRDRPAQLTAEERFWSKVNKDGPVPEHRPELGPCWIWTASINKGTGYGQFFPKRGEGMDAHRYSYLLAHGSIPEKHDVHHMCLVRKCCRPGHLAATTRSQNLAERMNRRGV
jgi:HNH endonuclease